MKLLPLEKLVCIDRRDDLFEPIYTFRGSMGSKVVLRPTWEQLKILSQFPIKQILGSPMYLLRLKGLQT